MQKSHLQRSNLFSSKHVSLKINILNRETNDFWLIYYFIATIQFVTLLFIWSCWASAQEIKLTTNEKKSLNIYNYTYFKWVTINNYRIVSRKTQAKNANNNVFVCQYLIWTTLQRSSCRKLLNIVKFKIIEFVREWLAVTNATHKKLKKKWIKNHVIDVFYVWLWILLHPNCAMCMKLLSSIERKFSLKFSFVALFLMHGYKYQDQPYNYSKKKRISWNRRKIC